MGSMLRGSDSLTVDVRFQEKRSSPCIAVRHTGRTLPGGKMEPYRGHLRVQGFACFSPERSTLDDDGKSGVFPVEKGEPSTRKTPHGRALPPREKKAAGNALGSCACLARAITLCAPPRSAFSADLRQNHWQSHARPRGRGWRCFGCCRIRTRIPETGCGSSWAGRALYRRPRRR